MNMSIQATDCNLHADARDFDFLLGSVWHVRNRRLKESLAGSDEWLEFAATNVARTLLGGLANEDEFRTEFWPGFIGMSFRFFNPQTGQWAIHWADNKRGILLPAVFGRFVDDTGVFEGQDTLDGKPIDVRFLWSRTRTANPRWEQAFSADAGVTWQTNWIMDFSREPM